MTDHPWRTTVAWRERSRLVRAWRLARTRRPRTFTQKVQYKMLRDRRPLIVTFADKAAVRDYIAGVVGAAHLPDCYAVLDDPAALRALRLPPSYVVKPTHGSGAVLAVTPDAPADAVLPEPNGPWVCRRVRPQVVDPDALEQLCAGWLAQVHGHGPNTEWAYSQIRPRLLVEEYLTAPDGGVPDDYKVFVIHGRCHYVQVDRGRFGAHQQSFFWPSWDPMPFSGGLPPVEPAPPRPDRLAQMVGLAERLGRDTDFVRVDFYLLADRILVGELTSYPGGGHGPFHPPSYDREFGLPWRVPRRYGG